MSEEENQSQKLTLQLQNHVNNAQNSASQAHRVLEEIKEKKQESNDILEGIGKEISFFRSQQTEIKGKKEEIDKLEKQYKQLKKAVEDLLPVATSNTLAGAFRERKESFKLPNRVWPAIFISSMVVLFFIAFLDPLTLKRASFNSDILSYFGLRIPFVIPLVWLAAYSSRRHSQTLRLEEDYAYKEVLSRSFEGYKDQILDVGNKTNDHSTIVGLITKTLDVLSLPPDRIYKGKQEDITPLNALKDKKNEE